VQTDTLSALMTSQLVQVVLAAIWWGCSYVILLAALLWLIPSSMCKRYESIHPLGELAKTSFRPEPDQKRKPRPTLE